MPTQVSELSPALAPLVEVTIEDQHVDDSSHVAALAQRGTAEATTQRINHGEVVGNIHADNDVAIRPVLGEPICEDLDRLVKRRGVTHHLVGDAMNRYRAGRDGHAWIDVGVLHQ